MDWIVICKALILGVVEGLTEFLPVSSTGHLIVAGSLLDFTDEHAKTFDVVIQLGAILAVCWEFRRRIGSVVVGLPTRPDARRFALNVIVATIPAVVLGLLFEKAIKAALFSPVPVAFALVIGGVLILWVEARGRERGASAARWMDRRRRWAPRPRWSGPTGTRCRSWRRCSPPRGCGPPIPGCGCARTCGRPTAIIWTCT